MIYLAIPGYFISSIIIMTFIAVVCIIVGRKAKKLKVGQQPSKFLSIFINFVKFFNGFVKNNIGKHWRHVAPMALTLALYIFFANISGLFLLDTPTKYTTITLALALFAVITIQSTGIVSRKVKHIKTWFEPMFFMFPINLMSDITPLISMTLRLFGNIASGAALLTLVYGITGYLAPVAALPVHLLFDVGFGFIQTVVFVLLTVIFSSNKIEESDLEINLKKEIN